MRSIGAATKLLKVHMMPPEASEFIKNFVEKNGNLRYFFKLFINYGRIFI